MDFKIRPGTVEDMPTVMALVKELADYEQAPHEVEVTLEELEKDFAMEYFHFLAAEVKGKVVGICLYFIKYSTWKGKCIYLDDIIVHDTYRGEGIGSKLFESLIGMAQEMGVRKLEWMVLNWNENAIGFYEKFPTVFDSEWILCKLTEKEIKKYPIQSN
ncbi:MAG: GNAT family N-acetyltransferase [Bacteroidota bacterium]|nr:GNAT family N-acetyltransferase [Bacteroidota bacterium]